MIDFHLIIDGSHGLLPSEAIFQAARAGYRAVCLVVRSDGRNIPDMADMAKHNAELGLFADLTVITGVELVHVPPALLPGAVADARRNGAGLVLVYGETLAGDVAPGTNFAAVEARADIISHPGLIDEQAAGYAAEKGVALEFSSRPKHALANAHVAHMAARYGCPLVCGSGAREAGEIVGQGVWRTLFKGANLSEEAVAAIRGSGTSLLAKLRAGPALSA